MSLAKIYVLILVESEVFMDQLIEILRRLVLAGVWLAATGFASVFAILAFREGNFTILLVSAGIMVVAWVAAKIINWIFIR